MNFVQWSRWWSTSLGNYQGVWKNNNQRVRGLISMADEAEFCSPAYSTFVVLYVTYNGALLYNKIMPFLLKDDSHRHFNNWCIVSIYW